MPPLVALTTVHGAFAAHVLAARLHHEGIDVELRGALGGAYGLTMGDMARVDLYVPEEQMEDAQLVLLASEVDAAMDYPDTEAGLRLGGVSWPWIAAMVLLTAAVLTPLLRILD